MKTRKNTIRVSAIRGILLFLIPINVLLSAFSFFPGTFSASRLWTITIPMSLYLPSRWMTIWTG